MSEALPASQTRPSSPLEVFRIFLRLGLPVCLFAGFVGGIFKTIGFLKRGYAFIQFGERGAFLQDRNDSHLQK